MRILSAVLAGAGLQFAFAHAASAEPLRGSWSGSGYVKPANGDRERVSCRVNYQPQGSSTVAVSATCASASTTIHQTGQLTMVSANKYIGDFYNSEYDMSGRIRVTVSGGSQSVSFSGDKGSGNLSLSRR